MKTLLALILTISAALNSTASCQEPAKTLLQSPTVDPNSPDVKSSITYDLGDRLLTIQEVTETTLPTPPPPPIPPPAPSAESLEAMKARAKQLRNRHLSFGGTVYRPVTGSPRSLITLHQGDGKGSLTFWSSFNWNLMHTGSFDAPDGQHYSLMLMINTMDIAALERLCANRGIVYKAPDIPDFTAGPATFKIVSGEATPQTLADLLTLHAIYDRDHETLLARWTEREAAQRKADAEKPTTPTKPENIVLQYRILKPEEIQSK